MSIRLLSSLRPALRLASANVLAAYRNVPRTTASAASSARAFPALSSYLQRHDGFHTSTRFLAAQQEVLSEEEEDELPSRFDEVKSLNATTAKAIKTVFKYETMSKVQSEVLSLLPTDTDMFVKAKTGTGKTLAFLIAAIENVLAKTDINELKRGDAITCLIISPTRELAQQIAEESRKLVNLHRFNVHCLVGGESKGAQIRQLVSRRVDFVVGTPGRLNDMIESVREFPTMLEGVKTLILDEADQLLDMGFKDSIESIVAAIPKERQTLFFSATVSSQIKSIARKTLKPDFTFIDTVDPNEANTNLQVEQSYCITPFEQQVPLLARIIDDHKKKNPAGKIMVFLPTTRGTQLYASIFDQISSYPHYSLHSKKSQDARTRTSERFRRTKGAVMFTSDVSARGVDYPDVSLILQVGIPSSKEQYIHRIGRTGRAGKTGEGLLIMSPVEESFLDQVPDLPLVPNELYMNADELLQDEKFMNKVNEAKASQDQMMINDAYTAFLGYYIGRMDVLTCPKDDILEAAKEYIMGLGAVEPPFLSDGFLAKLGFRTGKSSTRGGGNRFSRGGGNRFSYGRDSNDNGRRDNFSRDRSSSQSGSRDSFGGRGGRGSFGGRGGRDSGRDRSSGRNRDSRGSSNDMFSRD
ncbi:hypothetical protein BGZ65_003081 [Modicella reniformis]|uniref:ATP-dependent RNA helicase n=1 Tax=Modicella reniformis TaxID=1440133 RepID=A0A9P6ML05_9FUNG|nr:hypothetical protein BGZ65_003081 [Modicella reniformis]